MESKRLHVMIKAVGSIFQTPIFQTEMSSKHRSVNTSTSHVYSLQSIADDNREVGDSYKNLGVRLYIQVS